MSLIVVGFSRRTASLTALQQMAGASVHDLVCTTLALPVVREVAALSSGLGDWGVAA